MTGRTRCELEMGPCVGADPQSPRPSLTPNLGGRAQPLCEATPPMKAPTTFNPLQLQSPVFRPPFISSSVMSLWAPSVGAKQLKLLAWRLRGWLCHPLLPVPNSG